MRHSGRFLGPFSRVLGPLLKTGLPLMKNLLKPLTKSVLGPLGLTAASATDIAIQKKVSGSGKRTLIISKKKINDIMKISLLKYLVY